MYQSKPLITTSYVVKATKVFYSEVEIAQMGRVWNPAILSEATPLEPDLYMTQP